MKLRAGTLFALAALLLSACGNNDKPSSREGEGEFAEEPGICPADTTRSAAETFVCDLYNAAPAMSDSGGRHPFKDFQYAFFLDPEAELPEFVETLLYGAPFQRITDFRIGPADPATGSRVEVRFANYGREERLLFDLHYFDEEYSVTEVRYTSGHTLSELAGRAETEPPPDLLARYLKARKTWVDALVYDGGKHEEFEAMAAEKRHALANKRYQAESFLKAKIFALAGSRILRGFEKANGNNLMNCPYDGCHGVDGVYYDGDGSLTALITPEPLFKLAGEGLGDPPEFANALVDEAYFTRLGAVPVTAPDSLPGIEAVVGTIGQDFGGDMPPDYIALKATRRGQVYILLDGLEGAEKIPACAQAASGEAAEAAYAKCYAENLPAQSFYPGLMRRAQELADLMATF